VLARVPERRLRPWRWLIVVSWVALVASLFILPDGPGLRLWWTVGIPAAILCFLVLGHDTWRRICPLSAINQIPRRLGIGRTAVVPADAWLARHALSLQFILLAGGVILRLTLLNHSPFALGCFLVATMAAALLVGFVSGGKTWCHYICPMAPVQVVYSGPSGLLATGAARGASGPGLSQSMCRNGRDEPICVACNAPCPDIDLEKSYWDRLATGERRLVVYGYLGLVAGYVAHLRLGLDLGLAAPAIIGSIVLAGGLGWLAERVLRVGETGQHRLMTLTTVLAFALLISLGLLPALPEVLRLPVTAAATAAIALWAWQAWARTRSAWQRTTLAGVLRRRLVQLPLDLTPHLGGRTLEQLSADEISVLAAVLPGLNQDLRHKLYQGVLSDAAAAGQLGSTAGDQLLSGLRTQLGIEEHEHHALLAALPAVEAIPRVESYRLAVERLVLSGLAEGESLAQVSERRREPLAQLRSAYSISDQEQEQVLATLTSGEGLMGRAGHILLAQLVELSADRAALGTTGADAVLRDHLSERCRLLVNQLAGIREALGDQTTAGTALATAIAGAAVAPELLPGAGGTIVANAPAAARNRLTASEDPLIAAIAQHQPGTGALALRVTLAGTVIPLTGATARIGRDPTSDVVVTHALASRNHALAGADAQGTWIEDCGSANGLLVDGRLINGARVRLRPGSTIRIGADGPELTVAAVATPPGDRVGRFLTLRESALGGLPQAVLWDLAKSASQRVPVPQAILLAAGAQVEELFVVVAGEAHTFAGGREVGRIAPGETFGELGLITGDRAAATVRAGHGCVVLAIPGVRFASLAARQPAIAVALLAITSRRLTRTLSALEPDPERTLC
jgi:FHA domain/Cyclic nucleotide-binding domain